MELVGEDADAGECDVEETVVKQPADVVSSETAKNTESSLSADTDKLKRPKKKRKKYVKITVTGGFVAEWLACSTQAQ